jgi:hypothetical protein
MGFDYFSSGRSIRGEDISLSIIRGRNQYFPNIDGYIDNRPYDKKVKGKSQPCMVYFVMPNKNIPKGGLP